MCGVVGIHEPSGQGVAPAVAAGLFGIQHRGQDSCGLAALGADGTIRLHRGLGLVKEVFQPGVLEALSGATAIGHVRYPTAGKPTIENAQPHHIEGPEGRALALCSNGDLTEYPALRTELEQDGAVFYGQNDGELLGRWLAREMFTRGRTPVEAIQQLQRHVAGAYSACLIAAGRLYAFRDRHGFRPLSMGTTVGGGVVFASETVVLDVLRATNGLEVLPGQILEVHPNGSVSVHSCLEEDRIPLPTHCSFELIYFARPDAIQFGHRVYAFREHVGALLAEKDEAEADLVMPVPDSSNYIALGYARRSGVPLEFGLVRNHYVGRTFIKPQQSLRDEGVQEKFNPLPGIIEGKRIVLIDDSIVRGTTLRKIVRMIKGHGAKEVHVRIGSPPVTGPCPYGIDTPDRDQLIAATMSLAAVTEFLCADTLQYLELADLRKALKEHHRFCMACFDGRYPIPNDRA